MEIFGDAFIEIRNKYIIPLIQYGVARKKYEFWNLKEILTKNILSLNKISSNIYEIEAPKEDFMKSLVCDIELFFNKSLIQLAEHEGIYKNQSTWSYVTLYYFLFFSSTTLMRFLHRGYIFLSQSQIKNIESFSLAVYSIPIKLNAGNYYFSIKDSPTNGNLIVSINYRGEGIHKHTLLQLESILTSELLPFADGDESIILFQIIKAIKSFNSEFPSSLRNKLNYTGESCFLDLERTLPELNLSRITKDFRGGLLKLDLISNDKNKIYFSAYYAIFIFNYVHKMYEEYKMRSKLGKDFQLERQKLMKDVVLFD